MSKIIRLRFFRFFFKEGGIRHYLLPEDAWKSLKEDKEVYLEGLGADGRSYGTGYQELLRVKRIDFDLRSGFHEVAIDHPWWSMATCEKPDYPMGTGVKPIELDTRPVTLEHMGIFGC